MNRKPLDLRTALPCVHLDPHSPTSKTNPQGHTCQCPAKWLYECELHGQAARTSLAERTGVMACRTCPDYQTTHEELPKPPVKPTKSWTRHLAYHVLPVSGNGVWQRNLDRLLTRIQLFNGKKVVAILTPGTNDPPSLQLDPPELVKQYLSGTGCEFLEYPNNPSLREVVTFLPLLDRIFQDARSSDDVTFLAHTKGVTRPAGATSMVHQWGDVMYHVNLDHWDLVSAQLGRYPITGAFKKVGRGFGSSQSEWHYSGTFYWLKNSAVRERPNWRKLDRSWWGTESWPGLHYHHTEAGCLFHRGRVGTMDLYSQHYWDTVVTPELKNWKQKHSPSWPFFPSS